MSGLSFGAIDVMVELLWIDSYSPFDFCLLNNQKTNPRQTWGRGRGVAAITKPSRVDRAVERLDRALARLEAAANSAGPIGGGTAGDGGADAELRAENNRLRAQNDEVKGRLDGAIERLEKVLGG